MKILLRSAAQLSYKVDVAMGSCTTTMQAIAGFGAWPYEDLIGRDQCIAFLGLENNDAFKQATSAKKRKVDDTQHDGDTHEPTEKMLRAASSSVDALIAMHHGTLAISADEASEARTHASVELIELSKMAKVLAREIHHEAFAFLDAVMSKDA